MSVLYTASAEDYQISVNGIPLLDGFPDGSHFKISSDNNQWNYKKGIKGDVARMRISGSCFTVTLRLFPESKSAITLLALAYNDWSKFSNLAGTAAPFVFSIMNIHKFSLLFSGVGCALEKWPDTEQTDEGNQPAEFIIKSPISVFNPMGISGQISTTQLSIE